MDVSAITLTPRTASGLNSGVLDIVCCCRGYGFDPEAGSCVTVSVGIFLLWFSGNTVENRIRKVPSVQECEKNDRAR